MLDAARRPFLSPIDRRPRHGRANPGTFRYCERSVRRAATDSLMGSFRRVCRRRIHRPAGLIRHRGSRPVVLPGTVKTWLVAADLILLAVWVRQRARPALDPGGC